MDKHALEYYSAYSSQTSKGHFHHVIALHENHLVDWFEAKQLSPSLVKGWYELAQLPVKDRLELVCEFWLARLPYQPEMSAFILHFFSSLDDIGIFLTQKSYDEPFFPHLVYSLKENNGFFRGNPPISEAGLSQLQSDFQDVIFPQDYLAFLQIHDGFAKGEDTGIIPSIRMREMYEIFQLDILEEELPIMTTDLVSVNPVVLIPFYESFGMPFFQCFLGDWYPDQEMGNVYYSITTKTISCCRNKGECVETMAFESFLDWLMFYMEILE